MVLDAVESDRGPGNVGKDLEHSFGGWFLGSDGFTAGLQANDHFITIFQFTTDPIFQQNNDSQGQDQNPGQADNALLILKINRRSDLM